MKILRAVVLACFVGATGTDRVEAEKPVDGSPDRGKADKPLEERILGYWATDWEAMAESWQPLVKSLAAMAGGKDKANAEKEVVEEMKEGFRVMTVEITKNEMIHHMYPGRPDKATYTVKSVDAKTGTLVLTSAKSGGAPSSAKAVLKGDRLTLIESEGDKNLPMVLNRIDASAFEERRKAAAESELFKDDIGISEDAKALLDDLEKSEAELAARPESPDGYPIAQRVPGKPGHVFSPFNRRVIDVRDIPPGTLVQDPNFPAEEKKYFRLP